MGGELNMETLLATMKAELAPETFVFVTLADRKIPEDLTPKMIFQESEGTTLIVSKSQAETYELAYEFPCRMITLNVHSALEAVGFIANIATDLARAGMGVNPVAGFFHDHLFIPEGREEDALSLLREKALAAKARRTPDRFSGKAISETR